ncbi:hypothetical protein ACV1DR_16540 [Aeromonas jandaei]|uniref:hypothetical protein n=1 Tax=Aeromonas veronii TaxID=654 RepID=UPI0015DC9BC0|nr:hypothetical protein [Aeromonas veronii]BBQ55277.1 hypothetical protein WP2S18C03_43580 [Aeromonas veronii]
MKVNIEHYVEMQSSLFWKESRYLQYNDIAVIISSLLTDTFDVAEPIFIPVPSNIDPQIPRVQINARKRDDSIAINITISNIAITLSVNTTIAKEPDLVGMLLAMNMKLASGLIGGALSFKRIGIVFKGFNENSNPTDWIYQRYIKHDVSKDCLVEAGVQLVYRNSVHNVKYNDLTNFRVAFNNETQKEVLWVEKDINIVDGSVSEIKIQDVHVILDIVNNAIQR